MELSFCELRAKEVVNVCDGKRLGNIIDMVFDTKCGCIIGIVVPNEKNFLNFFKTCNDIFIPYNRICKIGKDVILVELNPSNQPSRLSTVYDTSVLSTNKSKIDSKYTKEHFDE